MVRAVYQQFAPGRRIAAYRPAIDASHPSATADLPASLTFLWNCLDEYPQLWLIGVSAYWSYPILHEELAFHTQVAHSLIEQALRQATSMLRPEIDQATTTMSLLGFLLGTISWRYHGWLILTEEECLYRLEAVIQPLFQASLTSTAHTAACALLIQEYHLQFAFFSSMIHELFYWLVAQLVD